MVCVKENVPRVSGDPKRNFHSTFKRLVSLPNLHHRKRKSQADLGEEGRRCPSGSLTGNAGHKVCWTISIYNPREQQDSQKFLDLYFVLTNEQQQQQTAWFLVGQVTHKKGAS